MSAQERKERRLKIEEDKRRAAELQLIEEELRKQQEEIERMAREAEEAKEVRNIW